MVVWTEKIEGVSAFATKSADRRIELKCTQCHDEVALKMGRGIQDYAASATTVFLLNEEIDLGDIEYRRC